MASYKGVPRGRELVDQLPAGHSGSTAVCGRPGPLSAAQVAAFNRDGVVLVRGLLNGPLLERTLEAKRNIGSSMSVSEYDAVGFRTWTQHKAFEDIVMRSAVPAAAAQLSPTVASGEDDLHVLRDAFFALRGAQQGCGWHVDDAFFWPAALDSPGPGVNIWIALDEVTEDGGGLAYAPGSHTEEFISTREVIRPSDQEGKPPSGPPLTCMMASLSPSENQRLEDIKEAPTMQPGDAIIHTRFIFHRGNPFVPGSAGAAGPGIARYSVRYMPSSAVLGGADVDPETKKFMFIPNQRISEYSDPSKFAKVDLGGASWEPAASSN